jgi:hypothetical protein
MLQKTILPLAFRSLSIPNPCGKRVFIAGLLLLAGGLLGGTAELAQASKGAFADDLNRTLSQPQLAVINSTQAGNAISVNGAVLPIPWVQIEGKIAIADYALSDQFGATFLNTEDFQIQPVQWFTSSSQPPVNLRAWLDSGYRFLDISDIAARYNWMLTPQGNTLQIAHSPTQLQAIRHEHHSWGDRLILDVTGATLTRLAEGIDEFTLVLSATADNPSIHSLPTEFFDAAVAGINLDPQPSQTVLTVQIPPGLRPVLSTSDNPHQVVIDIRKDFLQPRNILWAPGLRWRQQYVSVNGKPFPVYWLQVGLSDSQINLRPIWTDPLQATGISPLVNMAQRWQAAAAINAGFFNRNNQYPLGAVRFDDTWISGPILSRGVVGWNGNGEAVMRRLFLKQTLTTASGESFTIQALNSGYVEAGIGVYTSTWGAEYRPILDSEILVTVIDGQVVNQQRLTSDQSIPIPAEGYLLALRSFETAARALPPGIGVTIQSELLPGDLTPFSNIVGGGPLLLQNSSLVLNAEAEQFSSAFATQAAPRSAVGILASGELLLVAVHTSPTGAGPTLAELAQIMTQLGSIHALNLDGGSSASLYLGGRLLNRNPRSAARVNNGIGLFLD